MSKLDRKPEKEQGETFFAPAERLGQDQLSSEIQKISVHPAMDALLQTSRGMLAILNRQRQVLALNQSLIDSLGIEDPQQSLGLRPGEMVGCVHAWDNPQGGCGTSKLCASCGLAIAMVASIETAESQERICCIHFDKQGHEDDLYLAVRACPFVLDNQRLILIYLEDISEKQHWAMMEKVLFHDVNNILMALGGQAELLKDTSLEQQQQALQQIVHSANRLQRELELHNRLFSYKNDSAELMIEPVPIGDIARELLELAAQHPSGRNKKLQIDIDDPQFQLHTDQTVLMRVLSNMLINAMEATSDGDEVNIRCDCNEDSTLFRVQNPGCIPDQVAGRIFQRNFSTKGGVGRGLGTFSMKLFGEDLLGGKIGFGQFDNGQIEFRFLLPN